MKILPRRAIDIPPAELAALVAEAARLRPEWTWAALERHLGVSSDALRTRLDPGYKEMRNHRSRHRRPALIRGRHVVEPRANERDIAARLAEIPVIDTRSITGMVFGDPLAGRSALARRQSE